MTTKERHELYAELIQPHHELIKQDTAYYLHEMGCNTIISNDEATNYVLENLYKYIHTYNREMSLKTWIITVTKRCCTSLLKMEQRKNSVLLDTIRDEQILDSHKVLRNVKFATVKPRYCISYINTYNLPLIIDDDVYTALMGISERYLSVIIMSANGYTKKEISKAAGCDVENVKNLLHQARRKIKKRLSEIKRFRQKNTIIL